MIFDRNNEKLEKFAIQSSITNTLACLSEAQKLAVRREDIEALLVTAERWVIFAEKIKALDSPKQYMLGFTSDTEEHDE